MTREEERIWIRADRAYANACAERGGPILDHMSTANVARDMDLLRQAVGDGKMTFVGYSYGSHVGSTYANMFFGKVRAVVIDGVMDPVSFTTGRGDQARTLPADARLRSEQGAYDTLQAFLRLCDLGGANCAFSGGNPKRRYDRLAKRLLADGLRRGLVPRPHQPRPPVGLGQGGPPGRPPRPLLRPALELVRQHLRLLAGQGPGPLSRPLQPPDRQHRAGRGHRQRPRDPLPDAVSTARLLGRGRLLTVAGSGHTSLFLSSCADAHVSRYLLTGRVPPKGTVCAVDVVPFAEPVPVAATAEVSAQAYLLPPALQVAHQR